VGSIPQQGNTVPPPGCREWETIIDGIEDDTLGDTLLNNIHALWKPPLLLQERNDSALALLRRQLESHFLLKFFQVFLQYIFCKPPVDAVTNDWEETHTCTPAK